MSNHCMVNGQRCSKCCEVLTIGANYNFKLWCRYVQKNGIPDNFVESEHSGDAIALYSMLKPITKRAAKKINPHLVSKVGSKQSYFTCVHYTGDGCGNYENRPRMCSDYPYYGLSKEQFEDTNTFKGKGLYTDDCTYFIEVK